MKQAHLPSSCTRTCPTRAWPGRWPHGEEWIHEAATDTYLPLLAALHDLADEGVALPPDHRRHAGARRAARRRGRARQPRGVPRQTCASARESDIARFERERRRQHRARVARFYREPLRLAARPVPRTASDATSSARSAGCRTAATSSSRRAPRRTATCRCSSATHRSTRRSARASARTSATSARKPAVVLAAGVRVPARVHRRATACASRASRSSSPRRASCVLRRDACDPRRQPDRQGAGDAIGPYGEIPRRYTIPLTPVRRRPRDRTTFQPYWVARPQVAAIGRNVRHGPAGLVRPTTATPATSPTASSTRRTASRGCTTGRSPGARVDLGEKDAVRPRRRRSSARTSTPATSRRSSRTQVREYRASSGRYGIVSAAYDTELFGHWWFEGVDVAEGGAARPRRTARSST